MAVLVDSNTRVVVQGITGRQGSFHANLMKEYGTMIVAGVSPGKGGRSLLGIPVYDSMVEAVGEHDVDASVMFVPAQAALNAGLEAIHVGVKLLVVITEGMPPLDTMKLVARARAKGVRVVGPNCPGVISPGLSKVGIMPANAFAPGPIGVISRSGTLTYEIAWSLTRSGTGQSTVIGLGGDQVLGTSFMEVLLLMRDDPDTRGVVIIGEIGGEEEERCAAFLEETRFSKPVVAYVAGHSAPEERRMGHAGAIVTRGLGSYESKVAALGRAGVRVAGKPSDVAELIKGMV